MSECKCGRDLRPGEEQCPACYATKSHRRKRIVEVVGGVGVVVGVIVAKVLKTVKSA